MAEMSIAALSIFPGFLSRVHIHDNARLPGPALPNPMVDGTSMSPDKTAVSIGNLARIRPRLPRAGSQWDLWQVQKNCETDCLQAFFGQRNTACFGPWCLGTTAQSLGHKTE